MKSEILRLLKESDDYISGQQMCDRFHVSRTAVWKAIEQLKKEGYEIEAVRNRGYRLLESPDIMSEAEIRSLMDTEWAGKNTFILMRLILRIIGQKSWVRKTVFMEHFLWQIVRWLEKGEEAVCGNPQKESAFI